MQIKKGEDQEVVSRAGFFLSLAAELVKQDVDWASKHKIASTAMGCSSTNNEVLMDSSEDDAMYISQPRKKATLTAEGVEVLMNTVNTAQFNPCSFDSLPFEINKKSRTYKICNYEMQRPISGKGW